MEFGIFNDLSETQMDPLHYLYSALISLGLLFGHYTLSGQCTTPFLLPEQDIGTDSVTLRWFQSGSGLDSFSLDIAPKDMNLDDTADYTGINGEMIRIGSLTPGTEYHYRIRAHCGSQMSLWSAEGFFVTDLMNPSRCGLSLPLSDNNCNTGYFPDRYYIEVDSAPGSSLGADVWLESVSLVIEHYWPADLSLELTSPSGQSITLFEEAPIGGNHFGDITDATCTSVFRLSDFACTTYDTASPPFIGSFQPLDPINNLYDSSSVHGRWMLRFCDRAANASGEEAFIHHVELTFTGPDCRPPTNVEVIRSADSSLVSRKRVHAKVDSLYAVLIDPAHVPSWPPPLDAVIHAVSPGQSRDTLDGLDPGTAYQLYYVGKCGDQYSLPSCSYPFTTLCGPLQSYTHFDDLEICDELCSAECFIDPVWKNRGPSYWSPAAGETPSPGTGPTGDFRGNGQYIYHEATASLCGEGPAVLESSCLFVASQSNDCDLSFKYHMFGLDIGSLRLEGTTDAGMQWDTLWMEAGNKGDRWNSIRLGLDSLDGQFIILRFISEGHSGSRADVALDEIALHGLIPSTPVTYHPDSDGDGYGLQDSVLKLCSGQAPAGYVETGGDCHDGDSTINPGAEEIHCNLIDENCNGLQDDPEPGGLEYTVLETGGIHCAGDSTGRIVLQAEGGLPPYNYAWNNGADSSVLDRLPAGIYYGTITDQSGCMIRTEFFDLSPQVVMDFGLLQYDRPDCISEHNGLIELGIGGGIPPYDILWNTGDTSAMIDSLPAGQYQATVTESSGCTFRSPAYTLEAQSSLDAFFLKNAPSCATYDDGMIFLQVNGGFPPYDYSWNTGDTVKNITGLSGGVYSVTIEDASECIRIYDSITLPEPEPIDINVVEVREVRCYGQSNASLDIEVEGGTPPYSYVWTNGSQNYFTQDIQQLSAGTYDLTVTDANGCSAPPISIALDQPDPIRRDTAIIRASQCSNSYDGSILVEAHGGIPPYQYVWSQGTVDTNFIDSLSPGKYFLTLADAAGCRVDTFSFDLPNLDRDIPVDISILDSPACAGSTDGALAAFFPEALVPVQYVWNTGQGGITGIYSDTLFELDKGQYTITVTDQRGCTGSTSVNLTAPDPIVLDSLVRMQPLCHGDSNGLVRAHVTGGTEPLMYQWSQNDTSKIADSLTAGSYGLTVTDGNGCDEYFGPFHLNQPEPIIWNVSVVPAQSGLADGSISWTVLGGTPPFSAQWYPMEGQLDGTSIVQLPPGEYQLILSDQNDCRIDTFLTVEESVDIFSPDPFGGYHLYPVPARDKLYVRNRRSIPFAWSIWSVSGKKQGGHTEYTADEPVAIDCSGLSEGIYFLKLKDRYGRKKVLRFSVIR